jgi:hypothetical protein
MTGLRVSAKSAWSADQIEAFLRSSIIPIRLACLANGAPLVCSLWYLPRDGILWSATQSNAAILDFFRSDSSCGFEIAPNEPPYRGVRGQGAVQLVPEQGGDILGALVDRYRVGRDTSFARWLLSRADRETAIRIEPRWLSAWDFSARMR